ncbi:Crp/Fnr family transcriptional regulator [Cupriavidus pauculus]|uniref:Crp/Fnr family transcriptional regulator n=1 Tax=Cupriavidus pauculus TaxID=82633 RepID=UPI001EE1F96E|nr:helix-turn-helix domain-containing protein [Cupriavidus pauculus]GJG98544.1 hypothetical protein CBA19C6_28665 [Cupriavidus pauculus]
MIKLNKLVVQRKTLYKGAILFRIGDAAQGIYSLRSGAVREQLRANNGRTHVTGIHIAGDTFGLESLWSGVHQTEVICLEKATVCHIEGDGLADIACRDVEFGRPYMRMLAEHLRREQTAHMRFGCMNATERVADFLLDWSERVATDGRPANAFRLPMTRWALANLLGMSLQTIGRALTELAGKSWITATRGFITILDRPAMRARVDLFKSCEPTDRQKGDFT